MDGVWLISSLFVSLWILPRNGPRSWRNSRLLRPSPSFLSNNGSILKKNSIKKKSPSCAPQRSSSRIPVLCPLHPCSTRLLPPCGSLTNPPGLVSRKALQLQSHSLPFGRTDRGMARVGYQVTPHLIACSRCDAGMSAKGTCKLALLLTAEPLLSDKKRVYLVSDARMKWPKLWRERVSERGVWDVVQKRWDEQTLDRPKRDKVLIQACHWPRDGCANGRPQR
ncbi:uncharacterized protein CCOS01_14140 [Colletotrichum costaricense]|uniref:Transposase n=1 Tax=Colletotrichum costaricense TaxID=1209916 RepID=A0AAJ0DV49_9PEZI|nr:uncharacterized protein CCOS01_14140 [Colletotrichum costaricense]KAK1514200.1 hypothetical protein CCOS01_14140 [Colletotrichum costaricense]